MAIERHNWPGNIRELQNFIERSVILTKGAELRAPIAELTKSELQDGDIRTLEDANRAHIKATLRETNWVVGGPNGAATRLGMHRTTLIAMMERLGIPRDAATKSGGPASGESRIDPLLRFRARIRMSRNGSRGEDPGYDYSKSRLKNDTVADFRRIEAASGRT